SLSLLHSVSTPSCLLFFYTTTSTTEIYTLSLHDALPIYDPRHDGAKDGAHGRRHRAHRIDGATDGRPSPLHRAISLRRPVDPGIAPGACLRRRSRIRCRPRPARCRRVPVRTTTDRRLQRSCRCRRRHPLPDARRPSDRRRRRRLRLPEFRLPASGHLTRRPGDASEVIIPPRQGCQLASATFGVDHVVAGPVPAACREAASPEMTSAIAAHSCKGPASFWVVCQPSFVTCPPPSFLDFAQKGRRWVPVGTFE